MSLGSRISKHARRILERAGWIVYRRSRAPYGLSLLADIGRMAEAWDWDIDVVFDVGANTGQFAREAHGALPESVVYSFEPYPPTYEALLDEGLGKWSMPENVALGEASGEVTMYVYGGSQSTSTINSLVPDAPYPTRFGLAPEEATVGCTSIDSYCSSRGIDRIDLLKVDTEGFDLSVLRGADRMLRDGRVRFIYVEFNDLVEKSGVSRGALLPIATYLAQFGYDCMATYTDFIVMEKPFFKVSNALFALTLGTNGSGSSE